MSLQFNDTSNFRGLVQIYEKEIGVRRGFISGDTNLLKEFTADVNLVWDTYLQIALKASGRWQFDDSNHSKFPIIKTNLVSGQADYTFTTDEQGNLLLDIFKVMILPSATATQFEEIEPIDQQYAGAYKVDADDIARETGTTGVPYKYDKTANGIILDPTPDYNATNGLKVFINREASYFVHTDITKKPGCPGNHHRYFALKPALDYARRNNLDNYNTLSAEVLKYEGDETRGIIGSIERDFAYREKDVRKAITMKKINFI